MAGPLQSLARLIGRGAPEKKSISLDDPAALALFGVVSTAAGVHVSPAAAMRVPAVSAAVGLISESVGTMPVKVYDRADKAQVGSHPAHRLIHRQANPWTSATELRTAMTADALLRGHGYALVIRNSIGASIELHRLDPDIVTQETAPDGEPVYRVRHAAGDRLHPWRDILHVSAFAGVSPITLAREAIALSIASERHLSKFYSQGGRPSGVIQHPDKLDAESAKKISASWFQTHANGSGGNTAILDEGMTYTPVSGSHTDAQFLENRVEQIREIARAFRVPPPLLMELSRATWSNAEEMGRQFLTLTLRPWLSKWEAAYSRALLTPAEQDQFYIEFVADDLLSVDSAKRATAYSQYRSMGAMTANEVRAGLNLPPHQDGDELSNPFISTPEKDQTE